MNYAEEIAAALSIRPDQAAAAIRLLDEGNTIPFIARYRKEATDGLTDESLRALGEKLVYLRNLEERREAILSAIEAQGKLTAGLKKQIGEAKILSVLEDLYRPYRQKRRTRGMMARERGLEPLARCMKDPHGRDPAQEALRFIDPEKDIPDAAAALAGACDILAEELSDDAALREWIRRKTWKQGLLTAGKKKKAQEKETEASSAEPKNRKLAARSDVYENYYDFSAPLGRIPGHRILAVNRGEREGFLSVHIEAPADEIKEYLGGRLMKSGNPRAKDFLQSAAADAYVRLIAPSIENELRNVLTDKAEEGAIRIFAENLEQLLMEAPMEGRTVLGWDPAFRTGCKLAVADRTGKILDTAVIYPTPPQSRVEEACKVLKQLIGRYQIDLISLGNGTASRESEQIIRDFLREEHSSVKYVIVSEAGASVYSASALAAEEFPKFDVGQRSAASIARRLQDPLAELVKIDPKSVGVGQYQHDMDQKRLGEALSGVVEKAVNSVGVDINTASAQLLSYVAGIGMSLAKNIVAWREANGAFHTRKELLKVPKLGPKAFEQCAGFLRIRDGEEPLDNTAVHPESYEAAKTILKVLGFAENDLRHSMVKIRHPDLTALAKETGLGKYTLEDILSELEKPGRDPRKEAARPVLQQEVRELSDLKEGMELMGTVRNITDFGAFVDIGVHQDGLVHISEMAERFVKHPLDVVQLGQVVKVRILSVDEKKGRISLSMNMKN